jgi:hypothetical protein
LPYCADAEALSVGNLWHQVQTRCAPHCAGSAPNSSSRMSVSLVMSMVMEGTRRQPHYHRLDAAEYEQAITWNLTIADELFGPYQDQGKERCWGSFHVCRQTGLWYDFAAAVGGISPVELIQFLKKRAGEAWSFEDDPRWLVKFLAEHPGKGLELSVKE